MLIEHLDSNNFWEAGCFFSYSDLVSKSNYRKGQSWKPYKEFAENLNTLISFKVLESKHWDTNAWVVDGPLKKRPQIIISLFSRTTLDSDNALKSLQDALEGVFYKTDATVRRVSSQTLRAKPVANEDNLVIGVVRLPATASLVDIMEASHELDKLIFNRFLQLLPSS